MSLSTFTIPWATEFLHFIIFFILACSNSSAVFLFSLLLSLLVSDCLFLSLLVFTCLYLSLLVFSCLYLSLLVSTCLYLSLLVSTCLYLPLLVLSIRASTCLYLSLLFCKYISVNLRAKLPFYVCFCLLSRRLHFYLND